jgi:CreA protein
MQKFLATLFFMFFMASAHAAKVGCVSTSWHITGDDKACVESFKDPDVQGVVCHMSYAQTGGVKGTLGLAEDPSRFSLDCKQSGPLVMSKNLPDKQENIFTHSLSPFFKGVHVTRMYDRENNTLVYLAISDKIINGSPFNALSTVPLTPWGSNPVQMK